ncbi:MAG: hypothetical protein FJ303_11185 [Planctomycetes bacterium]|nr:hypothetical protein [Planctomycetota bacterium]
MRIDSNLWPRRVMLVVTALACGLFLLLGDSARAEPDDKDAIIKLQQKELERQQKEIELLKRTLREREAAILLLEEKVKVTHAKAVALEQRVKDVTHKNELLLRTLGEAMNHIVKLEAGGKPKPFLPRDPNTNPPAGRVDGKILKVEGAFVELSIGTDHGVNVNHTLDVYRLQPVPKYLGMIRIVDAKSQTSVGRPLDPKIKVELKVGDLVTSSLDAPKE